MSAPIVEVIARAIDSAWDYTPVERDHCVRFFTDAVIKELAKAGYAIVRKQND